MSNNGFGGFPPTPPVPGATAPDLYDPTTVGPRTGEQVADAVNVPAPPLWRSKSGPLTSLSSTPGTAGGTITSPSLTMDVVPEYWIVRAINYSSQNLAYITQDSGDSYWLLVTGEYNCIVLPGLGRTLTVTLYLLVNGVPTAIDDVGADAGSFMIIGATGYPLEMFHV